MWGEGVSPPSSAGHSQNLKERKLEVGIHRPAWAQDSSVDRVFFFFLINLLILFIYFWLCWVFVAVCGLLIAVGSLVVEHGI